MQTTMNRRDEGANAEQEIFRNFSKKLVQILKKNENFLLDDASDATKNTRENISHKLIMDKKRNFRLVAFPEDADLEDAVLMKAAARAASQLNDIIKQSNTPLAKESEFVQELSN